MLLKLIFTLSLFVTVANSEAQFRKVPAEVTDAFKNKFPTATKVSWKDRLVSFVADFFVANQGMRASFSGQGDWLKTETKYAFNNLPPAIKDGFKKSKYADYIVLSSTQIEDPENGIQYKIVVKKKESVRRNLLFSKTGQLLSDTGLL